MTHTADHHLLLNNNQAQAEYKEMRADFDTVKEEVGQRMPTIASEAKTETASPVFLTTCTLFKRRLSTRKRQSLLIVFAASTDE